VHVLHGDGSEEKGDKVWEECNSVLYQAHGAQSNFLAVDRRGSSPFVLQGIIFDLSSIADGDTEDGGTKIGMDGGFVAGCVKLELALGFSDYADKY
jgi:hypothetical protein